MTSYGHIIADSETDRQTNNVESECTGLLYRNLHKKNFSLMDLIEASIITFSLKNEITIKALLTDRRKKQLID